MCLHTIIKRHKKPIPEMIAYQIVYPGPRLGKTYRNYFIDNDVIKKVKNKRLGRRLAKHSNIKLSEFRYDEKINTYNSGFHCFTSKQNCINELHDPANIAIQVKAFNVHTIGEEYGNKIIVCDAIKPIKEVAVGYLVKRDRKRKGLPLINT